MNRARMIRDELCVCRRRPSVELENARAMRRGELIYAYTFRYLYLLDIFFFLFLTSAKETTTNIEVGGGGGAAR